MPEKTVLITGCSHGGLGAALAKAYRARGFKVFATLRSAAKAGSLDDIEGIEILELEVTSTESIRRCVATVEKLTGGRLDVLVNNAGIGYTMPLLDASIEEAKKVFDTDVWAVLAMTQAFAPMLIAAKGAVCNISSVSGELTFAWMGTYGSAKAAMTKISETLRLEMSPLGVRVVTVMLGGVSTTGNDPALKDDIVLPPNSYYQKIYEALNFAKKALVFPNKQNVDVAAKNLVDDVLSGRSGPIRRGNGSTMTWLCNTFLPTDVVTHMINDKAGLADLSRK